jgi:CRISPR-associated endonuclease Csy4
VRLESNNIGVSFPEHRESPPSLGAHMRIHGSSGALHQLMDTAWLDGMRDHIQLSSISPVPTHTKYCRINRVQAKSSPERLRRRAMRRHGIDANSAKQRIPDSAAETLRLPFVQLGSRSTQQPSFPLFIQHGPPQTQPMSGHFNSYGLSQDATVPWF